MNQWPSVLPPGACRMIEAVDDKLALHWDALPDGEFVDHLRSAMALLAESGHAEKCAKRLEDEARSVNRS